MDVMQRHSRSRRGVSLTEMLVSVSIFTLVGVTTVMLVVAAARASQDGIQFVSSESNARNATDFIRRQALVGQYLSVRITDGGNRVIFIDPVTETEPEFLFEDGTLSFLRDGGDEPLRLFQGLDDVRFELNAAGNLLRFEVVAPARNSFGIQRPVTLTDQILLRNLPPPGAPQFPPN